MVRQIRLLAAPELRDGLRNRRQLVIRGLTPLVLLAAIVALAVAAGGAEDRADERYRIAVEGPIDTLPDLWSTIAAFDDGRLMLERVDHAALAVATDHDAGLVVTATDPPAVTLVTDAPSTRSRAAASLLRALLYEDAPFAAGGPLAVVIEDVGVDPGTSSGVAGTRLMVGRAAAGLLLIQGTVVVGAAAARLHGRRTTGTLVSHLLIPGPRRHVVLGQAAAELGLTLVTSSPLLVLVGLVVALGLVADGAATAVPLGLVVLLAGAVALALPLVAVGVAVGLWARSAQQVAALTAGSFVAVAVLVRPVVVGPVPAPGLVAAIPLLGPATVVRDVIGGQGAGPSVVLAVAGTALATLVLVRLAARLVGREQTALRSWS